MISFNELSKIELKVGTVLEAEDVEAKKFLQVPKSARKWYNLLHGQWKKKI